MNKTLLSLIAGGCLLVAGCEDSDKEAARDYVPPGTAAVYGSWYKSPEGRTSGGWYWAWANIFLMQDGTNLSGYYKSEFYDADSIKGFVNKNQVHLDFVDFPVDSMNGTANGETMNLDGDTYTRISTDTAVGHMNTP